MGFFPKCRGPLPRPIGHVCDVNPVRIPRAKLTSSAAMVFCAIAWLAGVAGSGCAHHEPQQHPQPVVTDASSDTEIVSDDLSHRVQELAKHASTHPTSRPAPVTVAAGEKSTLIYT